MASGVLELDTQTGLTDGDWQPIDATTTLPSQATLTGSTLAHRIIRFPFSGGEFVIDITGNPPAWVVPTVKSIVSLLELEAGWDSYGAHPIDPDCVRAALELVCIVMRDNSPNPSVVPTSRGGIQLEWHMRGVDLEIELISRFRLSGYFNDQRTGVTWEKDLGSDLTPLVEAIETLSQQR